MKTPNPTPDKLAPDKPDDGDIAGLFAAPVAFADAPAFEGRVMRRLHLKLWLRQWLVVLAGGIGGLYALTQFVRLPGWVGGGRPDAPTTLRAGAELVDELQSRVIGLAGEAAQYVTFLQTPMFFWVSFALCLTLLALYYAYSQEEAL